MKQKLLVVFLLLNFYNISAQHQFGGKIGLSFTLGSIHKSLGINLNSFYIYDFVQINLQAKATYLFSSFGPQKPTPELQVSAGVLAAFGAEKDTILQHFFSPIENNTDRLFAGAFSYNIYADKIKTSQRTGTMALHINNFMIVMENDILAGEITDKYRTAGTGVYYRYRDYRFGINSILWTCDVLSKKVKRVKNTNYPSRHGYFDTSKEEYKEFSHGILSFQFESLLPYSQSARANIGIDSELIRNAIQNKFMHDMSFIPKKWDKAENPNIPMVDEKGEPYLYLEGQKIKPARFYWNLSANSGLFY